MKLVRLILYMTFLLKAKLPVESGTVVVATIFCVYVALLVLALLQEPWMTPSQRFFPCLPACALNLPCSQVTRTGHRISVWRAQVTLWGSGRVPRRYLFISYCIVAVCASGPTLQDADVSISAEFSIFDSKKYYGWKNDLKNVQRFREGGG